MEPNPPHPESTGSRLDAPRPTGVRTADSAWSSHALDADTGSFGVQWRPPPGRVHRADSQPRDAYRADPYEGDLVPVTVDGERESWSSSWSTASPAEPAPWSPAEQSRADQVRAEQLRAEQLRAEQSRFEQSPAEQSRFEQSPAEQRAEQARARQRAEQTAWSAPEQPSRSPVEQRLAAEHDSRLPADPDETAEPRGYEPGPSYAYAPPAARPFDQPPSYHSAHRSNGSPPNTGTTPVYSALTGQSESGVRPNPLAHLLPSTALPVPLPPPEPAGEADPPASVRQRFGPRPPAELPAAPARSHETTTDRAPQSLSHELVTPESVVPHSAPPHSASGARTYSGTSYSDTPPYSVTGSYSVVPRTPAGPPTPARGPARPAEQGTYLMPGQPPVYEPPPDPAEPEGFTGSHAQPDQSFAPPRESGSSAVRGALDTPESQARDQAARDQAAREHVVRDQIAREAVRDLARERAARDQAARDQAARDQAARDQAARDQASRDQASRDHAAREAAQDQAAGHAVEPGHDAGSGLAHAGQAPEHFEPESSGDYRSDYGWTTGTGSARPVPSSRAEPPAHPDDTDPTDGPVRPSAVQHGLPVQVDPRSRSNGSPQTNGYPPGGTSYGTGGRVYGGTNGASHQAKPPVGNQSLLGQAGVPWAPAQPGVVEGDTAGPSIHSPEAAEAAANAARAAKAASAAREARKRAFTDDRDAVSAAYAAAVDAEESEDADAAYAEAVDAQTNPADKMPAHLSYPPIIGGGALPQRIPAAPDVPDVPDGEPEDGFIEQERLPAVLASPELARIATRLRDDEEQEEEAPHRPDGFDMQAVLAAVREVDGVRDAQLRPNPNGVHTLRLDLQDGADGARVSREVARLLKQRMGLAAEPRKHAATGTNPVIPTSAIPASSIPSQSGPVDGDAPMLEPADFGPLGPSYAEASGLSPARDPLTDPLSRDHQPRDAQGRDAQGRETHGPETQGREMPGRETPGRDTMPVAGAAPAPRLPIPASAAENLGGAAAANAPNFGRGADERSRDAQRRHAVTGLRGRTAPDVRNGYPSAEPAQPAQPAAPVEGSRVVLDQVYVKTLGLDATVEVRLLSSRGPADGVANGPSVDAYILRLAAVAAALAIDNLLSTVDRWAQQPSRCFVEHAAVVPMGSCEVAVVVVLLATGSVVEQLSGSALVNGDPRQAVVRATLAAVNRRLDGLLG
jgi:hypothetical protein